MSAPLSPELVEELVSFVRDYADHMNGHLDVYTVRAAALSAKLPPPVDPDIEEARKLKLARALCNAIEPRRIAGELDAPVFDESRPKVQEYWLALAADTLAGERLTPAIDLGENR